MIAIKMIRYLLLLFAFAGWLAPIQAQTHVRWEPSVVKLMAGAGSTALFEHKVLLVNTSTQPVNFALGEQADWLGVTPLSGLIPVGSNVEITLVVNPAGLPIGTFSISVVANTVGQMLPAFLPVELEISGLTLITRPVSMTFDPVKDGSQTRLLNVQFSDAEPRPIQWEVKTNSGGNWLKIAGAQQVTSGIDLEVTADATKMAAGETHMGEIHFTSPEVSFLDHVVPVTLSVYGGVTRLTPVPNEMHFYVYGLDQVPAQPLHVDDANGNLLMFSIQKDPLDAPLSVSPTTADTPASLSVTLNTLGLAELPRRDKLELIPSHGERSTILPVYVEQEPPRVNAIAQVADGGPFRTGITVTNLDTVPALVTLRFRRAPGQTGVTVPWNIVVDNNARLENVTIPVGGSYTIRTSAATTEVNQGWAEVATNQKIGGTAVFEFIQPSGRTQEAAVPINSTLMQRLLLPFDNANGFVTSFAVINRHTTEAGRITGVFRDASGKIFKTVEFAPVPANGHRVYQLPYDFPDLVNKSGTIDLNSVSGSTGLLALRFNPGGAFTSFEAQSLNRRAFGRMSIPQVVDGFGPGGDGYLTEITLVNHSAAVARPTLKFYRDTTGGATEPWPLEFEGRDPLEPITIPPASSITLRTKGNQGVLSQGWGEIESTVWITGFAVFQQHVPGRVDQEAAVPVNIGTSLRQVLPVDNSGRWTTSVAVANINSAEIARVNLVARAENGQQLAFISLPPIPPRGHLVFRVEDRVAALADRRGTLEFAVAAESMSGEISVVGLRFLDDGTFTSMKSSSIR